MLNDIHHVAIIASDYETAKHFYVELLEMELLSEVYRPERRDHILFLKCGEQEIELFVMKDRPPRPSYPEALGLRHLAFRVESVADTVQWLKGKGIETEPVRIDPLTQTPMTFFRDPDGLPLEIRE